MMKTKTQKLAITGMLFAIGIILPFATAHGLGMSGGVLLPMHIPVFICGLLCGPLFGGLCGLFLPIINSFLTGMPPMYPMMPIMACELATYGLISGLLYYKTPLRTKKIGVYVAMLVAMVAGRVVYGLVAHLLLLINPDLQLATVWVAIVTGLPGIIVQIILVPAILFVVQGIFYRENINAIKSAKNLILDGKATCVVVKNQQIITIESGAGIKPIITMHENGQLAGAMVVDKIIGKATAMILVLGGATACYGLTMSQVAVEFLKSHGVKVKYDLLVKNIINRKGDGICPMEETVANVDSPEEALTALKNKLEELKNNIQSQ